MLKDQEASLTKKALFFFTKDLAITNMGAFISKWKCDCSYHTARPFDFLTQGANFFRNFAPPFPYYALKERNRHAITIGADTNGHYVRGDARRVAVSIDLIRNGNALQRESTLW